MLKTIYCLIGLNALIFLSACDESINTSVSQNKQKLKGVDVSHYQGVINWQGVASEGISFTFIKATQGEKTVDKQYKYNWQASLKSGLRRGVYHYFDPSVDAELQAKHFLNTVQSDFGELPPVVDIESFEKESAEDILKALKVFLSVIEDETSCAPIIYTSTNFWNSLKTHEFGHYLLWLADYAKQSKTPNGWKAWTFWQFESDGKIAGIDGMVDLSYFAHQKSVLESLSCDNK